MNCTENQHSARLDAFRHGMDGMPLVGRKRDGMAGMDHIVLFPFRQRHFLHVRPQKRNIHIAMPYQLAGKTQLFRRNIDSRAVCAMLRKIDGILGAAASDLQAIKPFQCFRQQLQRRIPCNQRPIMEIIR